MEDGAIARKRLKNGLRKNAGFLQVKDGFVMSVTPIL
tara:strand:- start:77 stop:187 length:111 start_codon:yes stop_codon:yes gene_type:complete